ncbi:unnamed protein product [Dibothriocephalus latus]|uniref:Helix-turn-helix domain-containing protein n=1 Tax=Dibothriocephalus latus TaxID=60516 RepID=A0A3P6VCT8_DIBLA|nr:unnamed protein product [Dibothriocephalus latus]
MVSFDVVLLFISIPLDLAIRCPEEVLQIHTTDLLDIYLQTNLSFLDQCYQQLKEVHMDLPISGFLAEALMQKLESIAFPITKPKFGLCYVVDTFVIIRKNDLDLLHKKLNSIFPGIEFTFETEVYGKYPYLDVLVHQNTDGPLRTSIHRKQTYSEIILHFKSNHPVSRKRSSVYSLLNRAYTQCSDDEGYREEMK